MTTQTPTTSNTFLWPGLISFSTVYWVMNSTTTERHLSKALIGGYRIIYPTMDTIVRIVVDTLWPTRRSMHSVLLGNVGCSVAAITKQDISTPDKENQKMVTKGLLSWSKSDGTVMRSMYATAVSRTQM